MDLHPYDTVCHDTTRHNSCHVPMMASYMTASYGHANHAF